MSYSQATLEAGLSTFNELLEAQYGCAIAYWSGLPEWGDREMLQIFRAIEGLILDPIADLAALDAPTSSDIGAKRAWVLCDQKIAGAEFEGSWQWRLLAAIDNATKSGAGQMMTPSDPRMFILKLRYEYDFFAALGEHFARFLCGSALIPLIEGDLSMTGGAVFAEPRLSRAAALQQIPGLETASPAFIAAMMYFLTRLGTKSFCDWALDGR